MASLVSVASAGSPSLTVSSSANAALAEKVAVNAEGRTLYSLQGETTHHLLCKTSTCLHAWPPLTVPSRSVKLHLGKGVTGHLAVIRRANGTLQVTLRGMPLYRFSGDSKRGQANGEDIESFGGTWHAAAASVGSSGAPAMPAPSPSESPYGY
ncbi:MAG TPA: hypothetical protein VH025_04120 [Solirubrobacteraceae bacterium]|nr:hypothetical protein [Solirubrobacteraceae bacterium]